MADSTPDSAALRGAVSRAQRRARRLAARRARALADRLSGGFSVPLDYRPSVSNSPRWGHGRPPHPRLAQIIARHEDRYRESLRMMLGYRDGLAAIARTEGEGSEPEWLNDFIPGLDGAAIYSFVRDREPRRYLEVGSGNSTRFAARAIRDGGLETEVISIDPFPRAEVEALCDVSIREPLESVDLRIFDSLAAGDVLFVDCSHRVFMNSDVVAFYCEVLPGLPAGVLVGVHDVYLPDDYDPWEREDYYSEQYLLAVAMLANPELLRPVLPAAHVSGRPDLAAILDPLWADPALAGVPRHGVGFWFENRGAWGE